MTEIKSQTFRTYPIRPKPEEDWNCRKRFIITGRNLSRITKGNFESFRNREPMEPYSSRSVTSKPWPVFQSSHSIAHSAGRRLRECCLGSG